jgi:WD40 repeat protein
LDRCRLSADGKHLLVFARQQRGKPWQTSVWDVEKGVLAVVLDENSPLNGGVLSPDGRYALLGGALGTMFDLWNVKEKKIIKAFKASDNWDYPAGFSADGKGFVLAKKKLNRCGLMI